MKPDSYRYRTHRTTLLALVALAILAAPLAAQDSEVDAETVQLLLETPLDLDFVPGEVIVKMKPTPAGAPTLPQADVLQDLGLGAEMRQTSGGEVILTLAPMPAAAPGEEVDVGAQTLAAVQALEETPDVEYAQPNYILQIARVPNDPRFGDQWHYGDAAGQEVGGIGLPPVWDTNTGDPSAVVAVIDTGILPNHPDITGSPNLLPGFDMISDTFRANDGDGRDADPTDTGDALLPNQCGPGSPPDRRASSWHGTHVAGTVGVGNTNNATGVAGVAWQVGVVPVRVLGRCGGTIADINDAIRWAAGLPVPGVPLNANPANVLNLSLGGAARCSDSPSTQQAIDDAIAQGVAIVVAAGNDGSDARNFLPASCNGVITVAAGDRRGRLASRYSNFGPRIDILAPGGDVGQGLDNGVLSMVQGGYAFYNGTSMAAPHVAGVAALLLAVESGLTPAQVLNRLQASSLPRSSSECGRPCGTGLLSADLFSDRFVVTPTDLRLDEGETGTLSVTFLTGGVPEAGETISFSSSDTGVATVTPTAVSGALGRATATVTAAGGGTATITASAMGKSGQAQVEVAGDNPAGGVWGFLVAALLALAYLWRRRATA